MGVGCQCPGRETWWGLGVSTQVGDVFGVGCQYPGREMCSGLGISTQVGRYGGGWASVPR